MQDRFSYGALMRRAERRYYSLIDNEGSKPLDPILDRHLYGLCDDVVSHSESPCRFNSPEAIGERLGITTFFLPEIRFNLSPATLPPYSSKVDEWPAFQLRVAAPVEELEAFARLLAGSGRFTDQALTDRFLRRAYDAASEQLHLLTLRADEDGLMMQPASLVYAWRLSDGRRVFPSAPIPLGTDERPWRLDIENPCFTEGEFIALCRLRRTPSQLMWRCTAETGNPAALLRKAGFSALDIFLAPAATALFPEKGELYFTNGANPHFIFSNPDSERIAAALNDPTGFRLLFSLSVEQLNATAGGSSGAESRWLPALTARRYSDLLTATEQPFNPDYASSLPIAGRRILFTGGHALAVELTRSLPLPAIAAADEGQDDYPDYDNSGASPDIFIVYRGRLVRLPEDASFYGFLLSATAGNLYLHRIFHPASDVEGIAVVSEDSYRWFEMKPLSVGGSGWWSADGSLPEVHQGSFPLPYPPTELASYSLPLPGYLGAADSQYPWLLPAAALTEVDSGELVTATAFSGHRAGVVFPLTSFGSQGVALLSYDATTRRWKVSDRLSSLEIIARSSASSGSTDETRRLLSRQERARLCCATMQGTAFLTNGGVMLQSLSSVKRLSARGMTFPAAVELVCHRDYNLLELRDNAGTGIWLYDLEGGSEFPMHSGSSPLADSSTMSDFSSLSTSSLDGEDVFTVSGPVVENPGKGSKRVWGVEIVTANGVGSPTPTEPDCRLSLFGSPDRRSWHHLGSVNGLTLTEVSVPYRWLRLEATVPSRLSKPIAFELLLL